MPVSGINLRPEPAVYEAAVIVAIPEPSEFERLTVVLSPPLINIPEPFDNVIGPTPEFLLWSTLSAPTIREVSPDGSQMWFIEKGVDYIADLSSNGLGEIKKATFIVPFPNQSPTNPTVSYDPSGSNQRKDPNDDVDDDNEDDS